jgi:hypothetical protein
MCAQRDRVGAMSRGVFHYGTTRVLMKNDVSGGAESSLAQRVGPAREPLPFGCNRLLFAWQRRDCCAKSQHRLAKGRIGHGGEDRRDDREQGDARARERRKVAGVRQDLVAHVRPVERDDDVPYGRGHLDAGILHAQHEDWLIRPADHMRCDAAEQDALEPAAVVRRHHHEVDLRRRQIIRERLTQASGALLQPLPRL